MQRFYVRGSESLQLLRSCNTIWIKLLESTEGEVLSYTTEKLYLVRTGDRLLRIDKVRTEITVKGGREKEGGHKIARQRPEMDSHKPETEGEMQPPTGEERYPSRTDRIYQSTVK